MSVAVQFSDPADLARCVDALLERADELEATQPLLARRHRAIADRLGDALDELPVPSGARARR